ncbi:carboxypeptidase M32 [Azohydromonas caseinilytica]|uniref:Metal-dependent carboxypeptidase n=1 Tax=Azohydromonas caseinilytica TaxID=2728836 RepID=A0A848FIA5_9BURK|nr:carboxypeptidase M32 [Azohydromonas caseinilytica]NML17571.1 carboxypeptidase M32 [Azohydromonas caseinilytica]
MSSPTPDYEALAATNRRLHRLEHLQSIAWWDQAAFMPPKGSEARAAALAELATLLHGLRTDPARQEQLDRAGQEPLDETQRANLREIRRELDLATALPASLVEARQIAGSRCEHAWRRQRPANDWKGFAANLREVVRLAREEAELLSQRLGVPRYDALMQRFEPGMSNAEVERVFGDLQTWLPDLVARVREKQASETVLVPQGPFDVAAQRALCERVMGLLGFDFEAGRLDVSTHPFTGGVPEDVRMTTRYRADEFLGSLMGTIHETGHGRYEQNLPREWLDQPVALARSMAIHESQSLSFEMQLGRHPGFIGFITPWLVETFGPQPALEAGNLQRLVTRVEPGFIRVDADELTYPAHVLLRWRIERALMEGEIEVDDIPALWDEQMRDLLGLDTRGNYRDGPMQDVHWTDGAFGYFPCYTLGAMYAAQWFATIRREHPQLDEEIARGELAPVFDWLRERIWLQGSRWTTAELTQRASGSALDPAHFRRHLEGRYLG